MHTSKQILMCQVETKKAAQISALCNRLGYQTKSVSSAAHAQSLGFLAGIQGIPRSGRDDARSTTSPITRPPEMLIFSGITEEELDEFLDAYRNAGIPPIPLKAILTPINVFWSVDRLYRELLTEHFRLQ